MDNPQNRQEAVQQVAAAAEEKSLIDVLFCLLDSWKLILCSALLSTLLALLYTLFAVTPMYQATSMLYVLSSAESAISFSDLQLGSALAQDYVKVFEMWEVHEEVISNLDLPYSYDEMENKLLKVTNQANTRMLEITITSPDPEEAAAIANEYAKVASQFIADTMSIRKPNIMSVALVPANPVTPRLDKNLIKGFLFGVLIACIFVFIRVVLNNKCRTAEDIMNYTGLTTLAVIPVEPNRESKSSGRRK